MERRSEEEVEKVSGRDLGREGTREVWEEGENGDRGKERSNWREGKRTEQHYDTGTQGKGE